MPEDEEDIPKMEEGERDQVIAEIVAAASGPAGGGNGGPGGGGEGGGAWGPAAMAAGEGAAGVIDGAIFHPDSLVAGAIGEHATGPDTRAEGPEGAGDD